MSETPEALSLGMHIARMIDGWLAICIHPRLSIRIMLVSAASVGDLTLAEVLKLGLTASVSFTSMKGGMRDPYDLTICCERIGSR